MQTKPTQWDTQISDSVDILYYGLGSVRFFWLLSQQGCIKLIESHSKDNFVTKDLYLK